MCQQLNLLFTRFTVAIIDSVIEDGQHETRPIILPDSDNEYVLVSVEDPAEVILLPMPPRSRARMGRATKARAARRRNVHLRHWPLVYLEVDGSCQYGSLACFNMIVRIFWHVWTKTRVNLLKCSIYSVTFFSSEDDSRYMHMLWIAYMDDKGVGCVLCILCCICAHINQQICIWHRKHMSHRLWLCNFMLITQRLTLFRIFWPLLVCTMFRE